MTQVFLVPESCRGILNVPRSFLIFNTLQYESILIAWCKAAGILPFEILHLNSAKCPKSIKCINNDPGVSSARGLSQKILNTPRSLFILNTLIQIYSDGPRTSRGHLTYWNITFKFFKIPQNYYMYNLDTLLCFRLLVYV